MAMMVIYVCSGSRSEYPSILVPHLLLTLSIIILLIILVPDSSLLLVILVPASSLLLELPMVLLTVLLLFSASPLVPSFLPSSRKDISAPIQMVATTTMRDFGDGLCARLTISRSAPALMMIVQIVMDARSIWGPQAHITLASPLPDAYTPIHRWRSVPRPRPDVRGVLFGVLVTIVGIAIFAASRVILARPHFPSAGLVPPASASAPVPVLPGEVKGPPLLVRLQAGRRGRGDHWPWFGDLTRSCLPLRVSLRSGSFSGQDPGPEVLHPLPGSSRSETGYRAFIVPFVNLRCTHT